MNWRRLIGLLALLLAGLTEGSALADDLAPAPGQVLVLLRLPAPHLRPGSDYGGSYGDGAGRAARHRIAAGLARRHGLALVDDWPMPLLGVDCFVMAVPAGRSPAAVAAALSELPGVAWSQPVSRFASLAINSFTAQATPARADPLFAAQPAALGWHLADLHRIADGRGVQVAVIDSAVDAGHPDLAGQVALRANFVAGQRDGPERAERHGTQVAGIIAARAGNGVGIAGIAPRARLLALRACWQPATPATTTSCDSFSLAKALYFALDSGAAVINLSLGGPADPLLARLIDVALARRITVVAAFDRRRDDGGFPASHPGVVAVADDAAVPLPAGVFTAPGQGVPTTQPGGGWALVDGSSYAAAQVSGLLALMRSEKPGRGALPVLVTAQGGGGAIDACASLRRAAIACKCACPAQIAAVPRP